MDGLEAAWVASVSGGSSRNTPRATPTGSRRGSSAVEELRSRGNSSLAADRNVTGGVTSRPEVAPPGEMGGDAAWARQLELDAAWAVTGTAAAADGRLSAASSNRRRPAATPPRSATARSVDRRSKPPSSARSSRSSAAQVPAAAPAAAPAKPPRNAGQQRVPDTATIANSWVFCYVCGTRLGYPSVLIHEPQCLTRWCATLGAKRESADAPQPVRTPQRPEFKQCADLEQYNSLAVSCASETAKLLARQRRKPAGTFFGEGRFGPGYSGAPPGAAVEDRARAAKVAPIPQPRVDGGWTGAQLRQLCKERGIRWFEGLPKADLLAYINAQHTEEYAGHFAMNKATKDKLMAGQTDELRRAQEEFGRAKLRQEALNQRAIAANPARAQQLKNELGTARDPLAQQQQQVDFVAQAHADRLAAMDAKHASLLKLVKEREPQPEYEGPEERERFKHWLASQFPTGCKGRRAHPAARAPLAQGEGAPHPDAHVSTTRRFKATLNSQFVGAAMTPRQAAPLIVSGTPGHVPPIGGMRVQLAPGCRGCGCPGEGGVGTIVSCAADGADCEVRWDSAEDLDGDGEVDVHTYYSGYKGIFQLQQERDNSYKED